MPKQSSNTIGNNELDPEDKELFLRTWDLKDGEMADLQILMGIRNGQLYELSTDSALRLPTFPQITTIQSYPLLWVQRRHESLMSLLLSAIALSNPSVLLPQVYGSPES